MFEHLNTRLVYWVSSVFRSQLLCIFTHTHFVVLVADVVISNADVYTTYKHLLATHQAPARTLKQERSSSALVFYWGIAAEFPELHLHNILFSNDYGREFKSLFAGGAPDEDPTIYINITSKCDANDAPEGCENWCLRRNSG